MLRKKGFIFLFMLGPLFVHAQVQKIKEGNPEPYFTLFLIGDAGDDTIPGDALRLLQEKTAHNSRSAVIFLGDNAYPHGLDISACDKKRNISEKKLTSQLSIFNNYPGKVYMVPGNHDWKNGLWKGLDHIKAEAACVDTYVQSNTHAENKQTGAFFPKDGLPGPVPVLLFDGTGTAFQSVRLIMFDTQWWLQQQFFHPVGIRAGMSRKQMDALFFNELDSMIKRFTAQGDRVILASHHPVFSNGSHSKKLEPLRFLTNIGLAQPLGLIGGNRFLIQNLYQPRYQRMRKKLLAVMDKYEQLILASGHEHNLQYFQSGKNKFIVSGAGSKQTKIHAKRVKDIFSDCSQHGFFQIDFYSGGTTTTEVWGSFKGERLFLETNP